MDTLRQNKVSRLLQKELATLLQAEARSQFPGRMITVTVVRVTPDLALAKVYLSIYPLNPGEKILETLKETAPALRNALARNIRNQVRVIPELAFYLDDSLDYFERIDKLLKPKR